LNMLGTLVLGPFAETKGPGLKRRNMEGVRWVNDDKLKS